AIGHCAGKIAEPVFVRQSGRRRKCRSDQMMRALFAIAFAALLCGCAAAPAKQDPLEPMNRAVFTFNEKADQFVLKPVAQAYKAVTPAPVRTGVGNFFGNISDVLTFANDLLQGKPKEAGDDLGRVLLNTSCGVGGLVDIATQAVIENHEEYLG